MKAAVREDMLERVLQSCDELVRLARSQSELFASGDPEFLDDLLQERDRFVSSLDAGIEILLSDDESGPAGAGVAMGLRALVGERLKELLGISHENERVLQARLARTKDELAEISQGRKGLSGYAHRSGGPAPIYVDRLG